jgi:hypothetical protein
MITWNLCNSAPHCPNAGNNKANALWDTLETNSVSPAAVGVQEACKSDSTADHYDTYDTLLAAFTWTGHKANWIRTIDGGASCDNVGIAVFWAGGCYNNDCRIDQVYEIQDPGDSEERANACGRAAWPGFMVCNTHTDDDIYYARRQASEEYSSLLAYMNGAVPTFGMGDFNQPPSSTGLDLLYFYWFESDGCASSTCWRNTHVSSSTGIGNKFDYIWFPKSSHCIEHDVQIIDKSTSDHHLLRGYPGAPPC